VLSAVEIDCNKFVTTGSLDKTLKVWNKTTCECLLSSPTTSEVFCMMRSNDKSRIVCGRFDGAVEIRRVDDLGAISASFQVHSKMVQCLRQLEDDSFVSGSDDTTVKRWDANGTVLQIFSEHSKGVVSVIELSSDLLMTSSMDTTLVWKVSTGQLLDTLTLRSRPVFELVKLSNDKCVIASSDQSIRVWNWVTGEFIETIATDYSIAAMTRLGDAIVTVNRYRIDVRKLKYVVVVIIITTISCFLSVLNR